MIKKILLGSAAVLALGTSAQAADPIAVALDTCDLLNITGLTISSETDCLKITGNVSFEWTWQTNAATTDADLDWALKAASTANSDFGPAMAVIELRELDDDVHVGANAQAVVLENAYVSIGDAAATVLSAGKKGSIAKDGDDETFTALFDLDGMDGNDEGIALTGDTGGYVLQVSSSLGDGVNGALGLEDLGDADNASLVGAIGVSQSWGTAHATFVYDDLISNAVNNWGFHTGATFNLDNAKIRGAFSTDQASVWTALISAQATFDMFTLAAGAEFQAANQWEAAISGVAKVDDNVTLTAAVRLEDGNLWDVALKGAFKVSDTLTASAKINFDEASVTTLNTDLDWAPGGGTTVNVGFNASSTGATSVSTKFAKTFE